jgi:hypothetical protein
LSTSERTTANLRLYLGERSWRTVRNRQRYDDFAPPPELELPADFALTVPKVAETAAAPDLPSVLQRLIATVAEIDSVEVEQLSAILEHSSRVLSLKIADSRSDGSIPFARLESMLDRLQRTFRDTASFALDEDQVVDKVPPEATAYVSECRFLQTSRGSFVANVELPDTRILRPQTSFNPEPQTTAADVNDRLLNVLSFVSESVLPSGYAAFTDDQVNKHLEFINLTVLADLSDLFETLAGPPLAFSFLGLSAFQRVVTPPLSPTILGVFKDYVRFVGERVLDIMELDVEARIVELRSRNPSGKKNYVGALTSLDGRETFVALHVPTSLYEVALNAHGRRQTVLIRGRARRMKTQVKVMDLHSFELARK